MKNAIQCMKWTWLLVVLGTMFSVAANRYAVNSNDWDKTSTWSATSGGPSGASVPVAGDNVYIAEASFYTVIIPTGYSAACANLQIGSAGTSTNGYLSFSAPSSSLTVSGNVDLYQPGDGWTREIDVWSGTLTINGNLSMNVGPSSTISTRVTKVKVSTGTVTVAGNLVFNNVAGGSALQNQLDLSVNTATFNLGGSFTIANNIGTLTPGTSSTFNFNGTSAQTIPVGVSSVVYNNLNINSTSASGATSSGAISATNVTGNIAVQSGTFSNGGFAIVGNAAKSFTVSNGATFTLAGTSGMVTGFGSKTFGATSTVVYAGADETVSSESYGHLTLSGGGTKTAAGNLTIAGDLTVSAGTLDLSTFTANRSAPGGTLTVFNGATLKIGSTNSFCSNYTTHTLGATSTVEYGGSSQTVANESYGHLTLSGGGTKTMPATSMTLLGNFSISGTDSVVAGGALTVNGNFTAGTGTAFSAGPFTHTFKGDYTALGRFYYPSGTIIFGGTTLQTVNADNTMNNVTIDNPGGLALANNMALNGVLTFTNGKIMVRNFDFIISLSASLTGVSSNKYFVIDGTGRVVRYGVDTNGKTYPIGTSTSYLPVTVKAASGSGGFGVRVSGSINPSTPNDNQAVQCTWTVSYGLITVPLASMVVQWNGSDEGPALVRSSAVSYRFNDTVWVKDGAAVISGTDPYTATITGLSKVGPYAIGNPDALPIVLTSFLGKLVQPGVVCLEWQTASEVNNYGFEVQRKSTRQSTFETIPNSFVPGHGTTLQPQRYSYMDASVTTGDWSYRLKQIDLDGTVHFTDAISVDVLTDVKDGARPTAFALEQNYPNPFNPETVVRYQLPVVSGQSPVVLRVYDLLGREVAVLVNERQTPGSYSVTFNASGLASGVYLYKLTAGDYVSTKRLVLVK